MSIESDVIKVIADKLDIPESGITLISTLNDLGVDFLDLIEIQMELEDKLNIIIPEHKEIDKTYTILDIIRLVELYI